MYRSSRRCPDVGLEQKAFHAGRRVDRAPARRRRRSAPRPKLDRDGAGTRSAKIAIDAARSRCRRSSYCGVGGRSAHRVLRGRNGGDHRNGERTSDGVLSDRRSSAPCRETDPRARGRLGLSEQRADHSSQNTLRSAGELVVIGFASRTSFVHLQRGKTIERFRHATPAAARDRRGRATFVGVAKTTVFTRAIAARARYAVLPSSTDGVRVDDAQKEPGPRSGMPGPPSRPASRPECAARGRHRGRAAEARAPPLPGHRRASHAAAGGGCRRASGVGARRPRAFPIRERAESRNANFSEAGREPRAASLRKRGQIATRSENNDDIASPTRRPRSCGRGECRADGKRISPADDGRVSRGGAIFSVEKHGSLADRQTDVALPDRDA